MEKIDIIPWNENFCTGINQIDKEHKKLVEIINNLATEFAYNTFKLDINTIFDELIDYTKYHFTSEEIIWDKYFKNQEDSEKHKKAHNNFINELHNLIKLQKKKPIEEIAEITLDFLVQWLVSHILETDRFMAYKVLSLIDGDSIEKAHKIAIQKMSGETKKLTTLIMSIYKVLSNNTLKLMREKARQEKVQKVLEEEKNKFEDIFKYSKDGIAILDLNYNFLDFNNSYLNMLGFSRKELLTKSCIEITAPKDIKKSIKAMEEVVNKGFITNFEKQCCTKDGTLINVNISASLQPDKKTVLVITKDVSSLKILEEQSKMAAMGEMIGNIAHQWRQPLSVISTAATGIKLQNNIDILTKEQLDSMCDTINNNAQYLSKTIDDFRNFIKGERVIKEFNLFETFETFMELMKGTIKQNFIKVNINVPKDISLNGYPNELIQCFINIFNNSKDALKNKDDDRIININAKIENNNLIIIFNDNAGGIPEEILPKIFEPYFTTKYKSQGTGLGLSMTYNLITTGMRGSISVYNKIFSDNKHSKGAEFKIILPIDDKISIK
ncbi:bacteriohemerythrin [Arcobacter arenosus]|uniref:histidine kinase n=1 Tax=Arcobacter arenosus TaxID=2576037 RepID=A0A5R8XY53_9BACT|nr:bacteriohemerythrin [Arcobacter arenosus]TLP36153.1 bacteriohemerythrin [Arcobacter arenosus]